jgi:hypothetical protein
MPYRIYKKGDGYKVCLVAKPSKCFSNKPLTHSKAEKQLIALNIAKNKKEGEGMDEMQIADGAEQSSSLRTKSEAKGGVVGGVGPGRQGMIGLTDVTKVDKRNTFQNQLETIGISPKDYLIVAKNLARKNDYKPDLLNFSEDSKHKLAYESPEGLRNFGARGYGDYIIWSYLEKKGTAPKGTSEKKRKDFINSHNTMTEKYKLGKFSANTLALKILWNA